MCEYIGDKKNCMGLVWLVFQVLIFFRYREQDWLPHHSLHWISETHQML